MIRDYTPIVLDGGPAHAAPKRVPAPAPSPLEPARAMPCEEGADDQGEWMLSGGREVIARKLVDSEVDHV